jgi:hypothetical protein
MENISYLSFTGLCDYKYVHENFEYKIGNEFLLYLKSIKTFHYNNLKWKIISGLNNFKICLSEYCDKKERESIIIIYVCSLFCKYVGSNFTLGPIYDFGTLIELYLTEQVEFEQLNIFLKDPWTSLLDIMFANTEIIVAYKQHDQTESTTNVLNENYEQVENEDVFVRTIAPPILPKLKIMFVDSIDIISQLPSNKILFARKIIIHIDGDKFGQIDILNEVSESSTEIILTAKGEYNHECDSNLLKFEYDRHANVDITYIVNQTVLIKYLHKNFNTEEFDFNEKMNSIMFDTIMPLREIKFEFYFK